MEFDVREGSGRRSRKSSLTFYLPSVMMHSVCLIVRGKCMSSPRRPVNAARVTKLCTHWCSWIEMARGIVQVEAHVFCVTTVHPRDSDHRNT